jgi:hypothetical protein
MLWYFRNPRECEYLATIRTFQQITILQSN